jgi:hypothetical protein
MIGKPCARKSHARFDEGELEIELLATTPALYSTLYLGSEGGEEGVVEVILLCWTTQNLN